MYLSCSISNLLYAFPLRFCAVLFPSVAVPLISFPFQCFSSPILSYSILVFSISMLFFARPFQSISHLVRSDLIYSISFHFRSSGFVSFLFHCSSIPLGSTPLLSMTVLVNSFGIVTFLFLLTSSLHSSVPLQLRTNPFHLCSSPFVAFPLPRKSIPNYSYLFLFCSLQFLSAPFLCCAKLCSSPLFDSVADQFITYISNSVPFLYCPFRPYSVSILFQSAHI